jgi:hypothetical protein
MHWCACTYPAVLTCWACGTGRGNTSPCIMHDDSGSPGISVEHAQVLVASNLGHLKICCTDAATLML